MAHRLWDHVTMTETCWLFGMVNKRTGYGQITLPHENRAKRTRPAHRVVYEMLVGPIPEGYDLDHLCRVRACVRVDHLEAVPRAENIRRWAARITHCPAGHEYSAENTYLPPSGVGRICRTCRRESVRTSRARQG